VNSEAAARALLRAPAPPPGAQPATPPGARPPGITPPSPAARPAEARPRPAAALLDRPTIRAGAYAWALLGGVALLSVAVLALGRLEILVVPLLLALFPAALLAGLAARLRRVVPPALAAAVVVLGFLALLSGTLALLAPAVASELGGLSDAALDGAEQVQAYLEAGPFGLQPVRVDDLIAQLQDRIADTEGLAGTVLGAASALAEGTAGLIFGVIALFFYLKDGPVIARWLRDLFPERLRPDAETIGSQTWLTMSGYIRGQLVIALVDAVLIGIGIWVLGVPLVIPLAVLVFFGGLFPIVGAVLSGLVAVLVALATSDPATALALLGVILVVQQVEGHILAPVVLGRAVSLHPLAVLASLAAGGALLGVLGAFIAIPLVGSATRAVGYLRTRIPG